MDNSELKQLIINRFREVRTIASQFYGFDFSTIKVNIHWDLTGVVAGSFNNQNNERYFRVNLTLARENLEDYLTKTVPHEYAHFIQRVHLKDTGSSHDLVWQDVMLDCFELNPARCHQYNLESVREVFEWHCPVCNRVINLTKKRNNDMLLNRKSWGCGRNHQWAKAVK